MLLGLLFSSVINWIIFLNESYTELSLPGQNMLGSHIALFSVFVYYLLKESSSFSLRIYYYLISAFLLVTSLFTMSKSSWLGIVFVILSIIISNFRLKINFSVIIIFLLALFLVKNNFEIISKLFEVEISSSEGSGSNEQRIADFKSAVLIALDYPLGVGSNYEFVAKNYVTESGLSWVQPDPHNTFAHILSTGGFLSLLFFIVMTFLIFFKAQKYSFPIYTLLVVSLILMQFNGDFYSLGYWWLICGLVYSYKIQIKLYY